jgi:hypothetical protein
VELYDIVGDTGETTDVSKQFPEITQRMLAECRRRWDYAITDGKAFRMGKLVIGHPGTNNYPDGTFWGYPAKLQQSSGNLRLHGGSLIGLNQEGDRAEYDLDVVKAGTYSITLTGKDMDAGAPLSIKVAGQTLTAQKVNSTSAEFGIAELPLGEMGLDIVAGMPTGKAQPLQIERIEFKYSETD